MKMRQSTPVSTALPPWLLAVLFLAVVVVPGVAHAQDRYRVAESENFRREANPNGRLLASINAGSELTGGVERSGWVEITLEGWIWANSMRDISNSSFTQEVTARGGENLRVDPNGRVIARLRQGFRVQEVERRRNWIRVKRTGWMWGRSLEKVTRVASAGGAVATEAPATQANAAPAPATQEVPLEGGLDFAATAHPAVVRTVPDGDTSGTLAAEVPVRIVARSGEWVRVRSEGWVHESDLEPSSDGVLIGVSGAEVRASPTQFEGQAVQWTVQFIAVETADGLRRELPAGQQYMLARGPVPESNFVYILLSPEQAEALSRVAPLAQLVVLARIRVGRSQYLGNPVLELVEMRVRQP